MQMMAQGTGTEQLPAGPEAQQQEEDLTSLHKRFLQDPAA